MSATGMTWRETGGPTAFCMMALQVIFSIIFSVELLLRLRVARLGLKMGSGQKAMLLFDAFLVVISWIDAITVLSGSETAASLFTLFRILRLMRVLRVLRLLNMCQELQLLCKGLFASFFAAFWAVALLGIMSFLGATLCTDLLGSQASKRGSKIEDLFGSMFLSMLTHIKLALVEAWPDIVGPMMHVSVWWFVYAALFLVIANCAILNVVTAVVCEKVMEIAKQMPPGERDAHVAQIDMYKRKMEKLFRRVDRDLSMDLSRHECLELLKTAETQELLQLMQVNLPLWEDHMLEIVSPGGKEDLEFSEFFAGILHQRGTRLDPCSQSLQHALFQENLCA